MAPALVSRKVSAPVSPSFSYSPRTFSGGARVPSHGERACVVVPRGPRAVSPSARIRLPLGYDRPFRLSAPAVSPLHARPLVCVAPFSSCGGAVSCQATACPVWIIRPWWGIIILRASATIKKSSGESEGAPLGHPRSQWERLAVVAVYVHPPLGRCLLIVHEAHSMPKFRAEA